VKFEQASKVKLWMPIRPRGGEGCTGREEPGAGARQLVNQRAPDPIHRGSEHSMYGRRSGLVGEARDWRRVAPPNVVIKGGGQSGSRRGSYDRGCRVNTGGGKGPYF
jgi:hypothetical protein